MKLDRTQKVVVGGYTHMFHFGRRRDPKKRRKEKVEEVDPVICHEVRTHGTSPAVIRRFWVPEAVARQEFALISGGLLREVGGTE